MKIRIPDIISKIQDDHQKKYNYSRFHLPISFSKNYQVKQVNHEVAKKHRRKSTYNNPNVHIKIFIPYIYLVKHLLQKFIYGILCITRVSKMSNHPMDNITNRHRILALNRLQMLLILRGSAK